MAITRPLNVGTIIDDADVASLHVRIFVLCGLAMIMDGFDTQALGYVAPALIREWGVAPSRLGPVFGATNLGVLIGQLSFTMLADKIGRRPVLVWGTLSFAILTLATAGASTIGQLLAIRLLSGVALGSIIPNAMALVGEYSPRRVRVRWMTWTSIGFTAGAALGGFVAQWAQWLIPSVGWRGVFYFGGIVPFALGLLMLWGLPESLQLLVLRGKEHEYVARMLARIAPTADVAGATEFVIREENKGGVPVVHLLQGGRASATILLWVVNFMNLFNLYSLSNWLPTVVTGAGYSTSTAVMIGTVLQVGGTISAFLIVWVILRAGFIPVLAVSFALGCISIAMIGYPGVPLLWLAVIVFIAGGAVIGSQSSLNALAATYYPTYLRSTGVGWALGIGRAGSIVGPVLAGEFMALRWTTRDIFLVLAIPAFISAVAVVSLRKFIESRPESVGRTE